MNINPAEKKILELVEEDFFGLWEILAAVMDCYPDLDLEGQREVAKSASQKLLNEKQIGVYEADFVNNTFSKVDRVFADSILSSDAAWGDPRIATKQYAI